VAAPKGEGTRIRIEVRKRNALKKKPIATVGAAYWDHGEWDQLVN
jgi:hypothetical protein